MKKPIILSQLNTGPKVVIVEVDADDTNWNRLFSIGFVPGTTVSFLSKTVFGWPLTFKLRVSKIAIRRNDTGCILVQPANA